MYKFLYTCHTDSNVTCFSHSEKALRPSPLLEVTQLMLIVSTDFSGQLIDFSFKSQSVTFQNNKYSTTPRWKSEILPIVKTQSTDIRQCLREVISVIVYIVHSPTNAIFIKIGKV